MSLFISALGPSLETFLKFKNSIGIQYNASAQWCLKSLDRYNFKHGNSTVLCKSLVVGWSIERSEHSNSKCGPWISPVREFGRYLRSMGDLDAYVLEYPVSQNSFRPEVYLLSDIEIQRFFKECDSYVLRKKTPGRPYVYPALYRFLYCCGARCGEARHLRCENVHLSDGYLDILQSKGHRDRRLFLSDELISYLIEYDCAIRNCFPKREYFFPGPSGNIISASSIPFNFRKISLVVGTAAKMARETCNAVPENVHCHLFRKTKAMDLYKNGIPLPFIMQLLGHESMSTTSGFYAFATLEMMSDAINKSVPIIGGTEKLWKNKNAKQALYTLD